MRRQDRQVTDRPGMIAIIEQCKVLRFVLMDGDTPYLVPVNFGWTSDGDTLEFYFHSAREGKKAGLLAAQPEVTFELDGGHRLRPAAQPCGYGFGFASLMGRAQVRRLTDAAQKILALQALMRHQTGEAFVFTPAMAETVDVWALRVTQMTAKRCD